MPHGPKSLIRTSATSAALALLIGALPTLAAPANVARPSEREDAATATSSADADGPDPVVRAATDDAVERLYARIADEPIDAGLTVGQLLDAVRGQQLLVSALDAVDAIDGPRVIARQFVQVRLQIDGSAVRDVLIRAVEANAERSPITVDGLRARTKLLAFRSFAATGTADAAAVADADRPASTQATGTSTQPGVNPAVDAARLDAAEALVDRILAARGASDPDLVRKLNDLSNRRRVVDALSRLRLSRVEQGGSEVRVTGTLSLDDLGPATVDELSRLSPALIEAIRAESATPVTGRADASVGRAPLELPPTPAWVSDPITVSAIALAHHGGKLVTAGAADRAARAVLREKLSALKLDGATSFANAAKRDRTIDAALDIATDAARVVGVDYRADGSVDLRLSVDGRQVWAALAMR